MAPRHVIVDGSNLATEGRNLPSLAQLDQAVREFIAENPTDVVTVVVDASFGHRIDPSEVPAFEEAEEAGEVVSPPAGAIGRGDAFLLRIAEKTGATVLSNDSFQEFHGEHTWLFDKGRLVGGKPVPGVGWIFMDRTPVRGAKSREVTKEAKRKKRAESEAPSAGSKHSSSGKAGGSAEGKSVATAARSGAADGKSGGSGADGKPKGRSKTVDRAIARATEEVVEPKSGAKRRRRTTAPPADPVNEPLAFITFVASNPLGSDVVGTVLEYSSHGAFVDADGARCYIPLSAMGEPPPRRAREVVTKGEDRTFVVQAFDPPRRGIELALPGFAKVAGAPTAETVEAEISPDPAFDDSDAPEMVEPAPRKRGRKAAAPVGVAEEPVGAAASGGPAGGDGEPGAPRKRAATRKSAAPRTAVSAEPTPAMAPAVPAKRSRKRVASEDGPGVVPPADAGADSDAAGAVAGRTGASGRTGAGGRTVDAARAASGAPKKAVAPRKAAKRAGSSELSGSSPVAGGPVGSPAPSEPVDQGAAGASAPARKAPAGKKAATAAPVPDGPAPGGAGTAASATPAKRTSAAKKAAARTDPPAVKQAPAVAKRAPAAKATRAAKSTSTGESAAAKKAAGTGPSGAAKKATGTGQPAAARKSPGKSVAKKAPATKKSPATKKATGETSPPA
ncbi:MAG TPA: hypothetical protein VG435_20340 [Acidimicrobiales bacterium]|jgi:hypothetical protein|nr:hypothetical protein [Acidimicrobiales bacterium]